MNNKFLNKYLPAIPIAFILGFSIFSHSCANTTTPPSGGPKDTIPPIIKKMSPAIGDTLVNRRKSEIVFTFDEYVVVKDPQSLFLSPPQEKAPKFKLKGKSIVITPQADLDSNRTYTLDLTNAVADNNEGNMFPGFVLCFSTGQSIDSMMITGIAQDCNTLQPIKGATVMLYKDQSDSAIFNTRPDAAVKTDDWGFFSLRNIQDTVYRLFAITDENNNNKYDPENEKIAFIDSLIRPTHKVNDSILELQKLDMEDTLLCLARKTEYELNIFREVPSKQMIVNKERVGDRTAYITFMAPNAQIDSLWITGLAPEKLITQFNPQKDSLEIWVNDPKEQPDTLHLNVKYMKTDTTGTLANFTEKVKLAFSREAKAAKSSKKDIKKEDTTTVFAIDAKPEMIEQYGFVLEFKYPLIEEAFDSIEFKSINPRQEEKKEKFTYTQDSINIRKYTIRPTKEYQEGFEYILKVPHRKFMDINGYYNDSTEVKVTLPNDEALSTLFINLSGVNNKYIVDLLNEDRTKIIRSFNVENDTQLIFPYITKGKYSIRITEDINKNSMVDTGNLLEKKQPEKVKFYKLQDGTFIIDIPEKTELEQSINIKDLFSNVQKQSTETANTADMDTTIAQTINQIDTLK